MGIANRAAQFDLGDSPQGGGRGPPDRRFRELDHHYRPLLQALAVSMRFSPEDAEDIVQQTLLDLFVEGCTPTRPIGLEGLVYALASTAMLSRRAGAHQRERLRVALARDARDGPDDARPGDGRIRRSRPRRVRLARGPRSVPRAA